MLILHNTSMEHFSMWYPQVWISHSTLAPFNFGFSVRRWETENFSQEEDGWRGGSHSHPPHPPPHRQEERAACHNLWLKKHEFFSAQWQGWHFMFTAIISLVNDSCGCGAYESFREQTETLMLRALNSFVGCCLNSQTVSGNRRNGDMSVGMKTKKIPFHLKVFVCFSFFLSIFKRHSSIF